MATKAVFLDALGTLVELEPPWVRLRGAVGDGIPEERLIAAVRAEMDYYKAHSHEGRDPESLTDLRARCAAVLSRELGAEVGVETLIESIRALEDRFPPETVVYSGHGPETTLGAELARNPFLAELRTS